MTVEAALEQVRVRVLPDGRMARKDAAAYLGCSEKTLAMWQLQGKGPASVLVGGRRFYFKDGLDLFIAKGNKSSTPAPQPVANTGQSASLTP